MSNDLIQASALTPATIFQPGGIDAVLAEIAQRARAEASDDVSTAKARANIASLAHKVARSKTVLDDAGKQLVADWKQKAAAVDAERKKARDTLDALKAEIRAPLDAWEAAEAEAAAAKQRAEAEAKAAAERRASMLLDIVDDLGGIVGHVCTGTDLDALAECLLDGRVRHVGPRQQ